MRTLILILLILLSLNSYCQIVFSETFDEADDATVGNDGIAAVAWLALCPGSIAATDYFKVSGNRLEAKDTNSPGATWETDNIDITVCDGVEISFDISELSDMEDCTDCPPGGDGLNCIDWVKLEYNLDGAGWTDVAGTTCALAESPGDMIQFGNIAGGGPITYTSPCIDFGTTLAIRISCMSWAAAEVWRFDNITVSCVSCILPFEIGNFQGLQVDDKIQLTWSTLSEADNDYFNIERSYDGLDFEPIGKINGANNSTTPIDYSFTDRTYANVGFIYYRLSQVNFNGKKTTTEPISVKINQPIAIYAKDKNITYTLKKKINPGTFMHIYNSNGQLIRKEELQNSGSITFNKTGFYIIVIPDLDYHQKIVIN